MDPARERLTATTVPAPVRVLFVDDDPLARAALDSSLGLGDGLEIESTWGSGPEILEDFDKLQPDAALIDLVLTAGGGDGIDLAVAMRDRDPSCATVILTSSQAPTNALRAWNAGIPGYITKHYLARHRSALAAMIRAVVSGVVVYQVDPRAVQSTSADLSARELEVLRLKAKGIPHHEIAERLHIAVRTVDSHLAHVRAKLGGDGIAKTLQIAGELGLLPARSHTARRSSAPDA